MTPMEPRKTWGLRAAFFLIWLSTRVPPITPLLRKIRQVQEDLTTLSFIHFARWAIIPRGGWPRLSHEQPRETLAYDYLLFESNFNGSWEQYIAAFSTVIPGGMDNIWRWSVKYPKSRPVTPFFNYIRGCQTDTDFYYSAYPGATTNDIRGAVLLHDALTTLAARCDTLTPAQFRAEYSRLLAEHQNGLSTTGPREMPYDTNQPERSNRMPINTPVQVGSQSGYRI
jgi:hypothetical protein